MPTRRPTSCPAASLLVLEHGAKFPFSAAGYRGGSDTAIIVQQRGEAPDGLRRRLHHAARELQQSGARLDTIALIVAPQEAQTSRRSTVLMLAELLDSHRTLVLVADRASSNLQHELISLVGVLIEQDQVTQSIAVDIHAAHVAEMRNAAAPLLERPDPAMVVQHQAVAC